MTWVGSRPLTTDDPDSQLDIEDWVGQRVATFAFGLVNGVTGEILGELHPIRQGATIRHDTSRIIKREMWLTLGASDTAAINPLTDRIIPSMVVAGQSWPLGRFMFTDETISQTTGGNSSAVRLFDEMFLVDQAISTSFAPSSGVGDSIINLLAGLPLLDVHVDATPYPATGGWAVGTNRGQILEALATQGDYMTPWINNDGRFRMIRTVDPDTATPSIDFDRGHRVIRDSINRTSDLLYAPNRFLVTSNGADAEAAPIIGIYDVPPSAPYSIAQRGFVIQRTDNIQVVSAGQAAAAARNIGIRASVFDRVELATVPDPRHDSYDVIRWDGVNWLELSWTMVLQDGAPMTHVLRRSFM